ncbi:MAG TPA: MBL fold metallo-hydrolase [Gaiellaceae bacterium]|nr:MBL fold metallo-hydrolase [Gaiellaceae bacterium]
MDATDVMRVRDTCNVWVLRRGRDGVCIDFGSGAVLDRLDELGLDRVTDVLLTHHHRDQAQGLGRALEAGARVWVPPVEQELFTRATAFWEQRRLDDTYETRQEALSLLESVPVTGAVDEYRMRAYGGVEVYTLPTPGHTVGSVTYLVEVDGEQVAFTGDLLYGPGQVWSLAATQWTYGGTEGLAASLLSCELLARRGVARLLPAHGEPMEEPARALAATQERLAELMELRRVETAPFDYRRWVERPWREISPHVLLNTTSISNAYALLSDSGAALLLDWGYDLWTGWPLGGPRHANRPLLASVEALFRDHGVQRVDALLTTHYHDDHVAGANLLRDVHGAEVWSPENVAPILESPERYDLPCLWFDPVPVDRVLPFGEPVEWHEHRLTLHPLPGHTRYAAAVEFEADGTRYLATGDQQTHQADGRLIANYQYRNRFAIDDYVRSAELYERLRPDVLLTGHWTAHELDPAALAAHAADAARIAELHRGLLPVEDAEGVYARIVPYRSTVAAGGTLELAVEVRNPFADARRATVALVLPEGWRAEPARHEVELAPGEERSVAFSVSAGGGSRRVPVAVDLTLGDTPLGRHAEALVTVR